MRDGESKTESEACVHVEWKDLAEFRRVVVNGASRGALHGSNLSLATARRLLQHELQHALPDTAISETISVDRHLARRVAVSGSASGPCTEETPSDTTNGDNRTSREVCRSIGREADQREATNRGMKSEQL